jgi:glycosyltransferase involved in cell wall biosynthesis
MRLSIVIPVYNVEKYIAKCLDSALDQGLHTKDYEIIVVSDGSTDGSFKIAQSYAKVNSHIKVIEKENGGIGSARHCGMDVAQGKYIYFLDSDDYLVSNCLNKIVDTCDHHNLDILTFRSSSFSSLSSKDDSNLNKKNFNVSSEGNTLSPIVTGEEYVSTVKYRSEAWSYITNREFLSKSGIRFVEKRYLEDVVFSIKLFLRTERMAHLELYAHKYRVRPGSAMTSKKPSHYLKIIRDLQYAVLGFEPVIKTLENKRAHPDCITRVKDRQRSLLFFSMIRMFNSTMSFDEVKLRMTEMTSTNAYPLDSSSGKDYNSITYQILYSLFKTKRRFYFFFRLVNPILRLRYRFSRE